MSWLAGLDTLEAKGWYAEGRAGRAQPYSRDEQTEAPRGKAPPPASIMFSLLSPKTHLSTCPVLHSSQDGLCRQPTSSSCLLFGMVKADLSLSSSALPTRPGPPSGPSHSSPAWFVGLSPFRPQRGYGLRWVEERLLYWTDRRGSSAFCLDRGTGSY